MKKVIQIITIIICSLLLMATNNSKAYISTDEDVIFSTNGKYQEIYYQGEVLCIPIAVCNRQTGKTLPIYNLQREKLYLTEGLAYYSKIDSVQKNDAARRVLLCGYPNVTFQELGCENEEEAYIITQIALLNVYYHYNLNDFTVTNKNIYPHILNNLCALIQKAENSTERYIQPELTIDDETIEWQKENIGEDSKTYKIISNLNFENYTVAINGNDKVKVVNEQNEEKQTFNYGEKFKIVVSSFADIDFEITVVAEFDTNPMRIGNALNEEWETYVILDNSELVKDSLKQTHTKIIHTEEKPGTDVGSSDNLEERQIINETQIFTNKKLPITGF